MQKLLLTLNEELVRALHDLADWEGSQEIHMAANLAQLALEKVKPERSLRRSYTALTGREREVAALSAQGCSHALIGERLCISRGTVRAHLYNIRIKMGVGSSAELRRALEDLPEEVRG